MKELIALERVNILGVGVDAINMAMTLETIEGWIARRESHYVCVTGVSRCDGEPS